MTRGLRTAAAGMAVQLRKQEMYANNLANASTVGYRRADVAVGAFHVLLRQAEQSQAPSLPRSESTIIDEAQGPLHETRDPFDLALVGRGMFTLQADEGLRYTRDGRFSLDGDSNLISVAGHQVMGEGGPIVLPGPDFHVTQAGEVFSEGQFVDRLFVGEFDEDATLTRESDGLFNADTGPQMAEETSVEQGYVEEANVRVVRELGQMMTGFRAFEASSTALRVTDETLGTLIESTGR